MIGEELDCELYEITGLIQGNVKGGQLLNFKL
jgi:hypothetical protein